MMKTSLRRSSGRRRISGNPFHSELLQRYEAWLAGARGLAPASVWKHLTLTGTMLKGLRVRRASQLTGWTPEIIERYVSKEARRCPLSGRGIASCIRSFLRFLLQEGLIQRELSAAVPRCAHWRLAPLPTTLRADEVRRLIGAVDVRTPLGKRNRAILLCMSELGLRASDVAGLELDGIDQRIRVLRLRRRKEREEAALPMTERLAAALNVYLRSGRPTCTSSAVFVLHRAPVGNPITPLGICSMVLSVAARAGLRDRIGGTHVLRRSVASRMLNAGATLKQVADLLGHQCLTTTSLYAKVDLRTLSRVALPWPGTQGVRR